MLGIAKVTHLDQRPLAVVQQGVLLYEQDTAIEQNNGAGDSIIS